ncbi:hypothetical protein GCM10009007_03720 [Formosimonas limnophila]|uniref:Uncharacterized protein n=1 Tax=Formosimonas limnophila TaxID=1384487 RepID=A0A8J3CLF5_9BURK|nr:hypothetical protein GCM10009007_03720 [Formosimonas limnophila]
MAGWSKDIGKGWKVWGRGGMMTGVLVSLEKHMESALLIWAVVVAWGVVLAIIKDFALRIA